MVQPLSSATPLPTLATPPSEQPVPTFFSPFQTATLSRSPTLGGMRLCLVIANVPEHGGHRADHHASPPPISHSSRLCTRADRVHGSAQAGIPVSWCPGRCGTTKPKQYRNPSTWNCSSEPATTGTGADSEARSVLASPSYHADGPSLPRTSTTGHATSRPIRCEVLHAITTRRRPVYAL